MSVIYTARTSISAQELDEQGHDPLTTKVMTLLDQDAFSKALLAYSQQHETWKLKGGGYTDDHLDKMEHALNMGQNPLSKDYYDQHLTEDVIKYSYLMGNHKLLDDGTIRCRFVDKILPKSARLRSDLADALDDMQGHYTDNLKHVASVELCHLQIPKGFVGPHLFREVANDNNAAASSVPVLSGALSTTGGPTRQLHETRDGGAILGLDAPGGLDMDHLFREQLPTVSGPHSNIFHDVSHQIPQLHARAGRTMAPHSSSTMQAASGVHSSMRQPGLQQPYVAPMGFVPQGFPGAFRGFHPAMAMAIPTGGQPFVPGRGFAGNVGTMPPTHGRQPLQPFGIPMGDPRVPHRPTVAGTPRITAPTAQQQQTATTGARQATETETAVPDDAASDNPTSTWDDMKAALQQLQQESQTEAEKYKTKWEECKAALAEKEKELEGKERDLNAALKELAKLREMSSTMPSDDNQNSQDKENRGENNNSNKAW